LRDLSVLVDHVGDPARVLVFRRVGGAVCDADLPVSQRSGYGKSFFFANFALSSTLSKLTPTIFAFFSSYSAERSRNPEPSAVQPPVSAFG
jgi:hypothetical protein